MGGSAAVATGRLVRPMTPDDIPAVAALFTRVFRPGAAAPDPALSAYLAALCFTAPGYAPDTGSMVYDHPCVGIRAALLSIPLRFRFDGAPVTARLMGSFMSDGREGQVGAARLSRYFRAHNHDLLAADSASPVSADHWVTGGGLVLPVQSLEWRRVFRPARAAALQLRRSLPRIGSMVALAPLGMADRPIRRLRPALSVQPATGLAVERVEAEAFRLAVEPMLAHFRLRPDWDRAEFDWLTAQIDQNHRLGQVQFRLVRDVTGEPMGGFLFCGRPGHHAEVFNILCRPAAENDTVAAMLADLDAEGYAVAGGIAQPFLMTALQRHRWLTLRHRGFFCIASRHAAVMEAIRADSLYVGGLASESWSRLQADF
ncbi:GNAT family N-acetyltransferase [Pannonibacter tanglangensis]|uniref:GNAT family N-acetyltransferase n=1 Tax=Pannonibacter tanglangensis TaxID=2750084 RepID=A0ABW9ZMV4_9HYPH|nr:GNAT family N-acetyltransferase [Pannonibacter sp. XCT-34]NBN64349.1 GNAT family N-acetyltransferase [Pannonibacter sp. XCT-34]